MACRLDKNKNGKIIGVKVDAPIENGISTKQRQKIVEKSKEIVKDLQNTGLAKDVIFLDTKGIQDKLNSINGRYGVSFQYNNNKISIFRGGELVENTSNSLGNLGLGHYFVDDYNIASSFANRSNGEIHKLEINDAKFANEYDTISYEQLKELDEKLNLRLIKDDYDELEESYGYEFPIGEVYSQIISPIVENSNLTTYDVARVMYDVTGYFGLKGEYYGKTQYLIFDYYYYFRNSDDINIYHQVLNINGNHKVKGFVYDNTVYLNIDEMSLDTPIHEFGHLWINYVKENNYNLYAKGIELIDRYGKEYLLEAMRLQPNLSDTQLKEEALAQLIGDNGARILEKSERKTISAWLKDIWDMLKGMFGLSDRIDDLSNVTLSEFSKLVAVDLLKGTDKVKFTNPYTISPLLDEMLANKKGKYISIVTIKQILNKPTIKKIEKDIINEVLELEKFTGKKKIFFNEFVGEVQSRIMPLKVINSNTYSNYGSDEVGIELYDHSSHIYTSPIAHNYTGHFSKDLGIRDNNEIKLKIVPIQDKFAVVREGVELNEHNVADNVLTIKSTEEDAQYFIDTFKNNKVKGGLFGHTRVWVDSNHTDTALVAEVKSDAYQKREIEDLLYEYYSQNKDNGNKEINQLIKLIDEKEDELMKFYSYYTSQYFQYLDKKYPYNHDFVRKQMKYILEHKQFDVNLINKKIEEITTDEYYDDDSFDFDLPFNMKIIFDNDIYTLQLKGEFRDYDTIQDITEDINNILKNDSDFERMFEYIKVENEIKELKNKLKDISPTTAKQFRSLKKYFTHRLLREEIRLNAQKGYNKLAIPTPLTLAKIEGYIEGAYSIVEAEDSSYLQDGDIINYLGEEHYVVESSMDNVWIVPADKFNSVNLEQYIWESIDNSVEDDKYEFEHLFENEYITEKEFDKYKYDFPLSLRYAEISDIANETKKGVYKVDVNKLESKIREYWKEKYNGYDDNDWVDIFKNSYGFYNVFIKNGEIFYTKNNEDYERLAQLNNNNSELDYDEIDDVYRPILKRYEKLNEWFKKERGDTREINIKGNSWIVTDLTSDDYAKPIIAFQIGNKENTVNSQVYNEFISNPVLHPTINDNTVTETAIQKVKLLEQTNEIDKNCK